ncbi:MAG: stimulus-sensing domain-containing protein [Alphaproteobacteria bacterium]
MLRSRRRVEASDGAKRTDAPARRGPRARGSPITRRILAVNVLALAILFGGVFYLDDYERRLVDAELDALRQQGEVIAIALGETMLASDDDSIVVFDSAQVRQLLPHVMAATRARARLFSVSGALVADSRLVEGPGGVIAVEQLPEQRTAYPIIDPLIRVFNWVVNWVPRRVGLELYREYSVPRADQYQEVEAALSGETAVHVRGTADEGMILSAAVPVQHYRKIAGALLLTKDSRSIERGLRIVREDILRIFAISLGVTVLLSLYLAGTIARPIRRLAAAAERVRLGPGRRETLPDFGATRSDEIGELATTLREMTEALWQRMDAIERFAADVSHEIKNPLSSLRSAVETAYRIKDPEQQKRLMTIILEDVQRLDRLISDISDASRLDAELLREESVPVDVGRMIATMIDVHRETDMGGPNLVLDSESREPLIVAGVEDRLGQVLRNLIANAVSFSPPGGTIRLGAVRRGTEVEITVEDEGPGIPDGKFEAIFGRFYSERPAGEKFGTHSGLGLSISKQIVETHGGTIRAENRMDSAGQVKGARFIVRLPRIVA